MSQTFENSSKELLVYRAKKLVENFEFMENNKFLIAMSVYLLIKSALGFCGEELMHFLLKDLVLALRMEAAFCAHCDRRIDFNLSDYPLCLECASKEKIEFDQINKEIDRILS